MAIYEEKNYKRPYFYQLIPLFAFYTKTENVIENVIFYICKASLSFYTCLKVKHQRKADYNQLFSDA